MRNIHPSHRRFIFEQPFGDVTDFAARWQWIDHARGMWRSWVDTPVDEKIRLVSLSNGAVMAHRWN